MSYSPIRFEPAAKNQNPNETNSLRAVEQSGSKQPESNYALIVHSHLSWDWVWQRPQQFLSRLSRRHKILFVEVACPAPDLAAPQATFRKLEAFPNITILRLQFPCWRWNDGDYVDAERRRLVQEFLAGPVRGQFENPVQWFYDPMAVTAFGGEMNEVLTVYDCMDELSKFNGAPRELKKREAELLRMADVVFTGGHKLWEAKRRVHENCHFYGCGVDAEHFGKALAPETEVAAEVAALKRPVLGYFGVIDERLDYELISKLADANPGWSVAMVGPVMKVDARQLPQRPNLHWLGHKPYADLPRLCKGFDVCLMPFALNEATEYINPTKALEYMATGRPIVSTAISDVARNFGEQVSVSRTAREFIQACHEGVENPDGERIESGLRKAQASSWDSIVERLEQHIAVALAAKVAQQAEAEQPQVERALRRKRLRRHSTLTALLNPVRASA